MIGSAGLSGCFGPEFGVCQALERGAQSGGIHEGEHAVEPPVRASNQISHGPIEVELTRGVAANPHLVFDGAAAHPVALSQGAILCDDEFGHDE